MLRNMQIVTSLESFALRERERKGGAHRRMKVGGLLYSEFPFSIIPFPNNSFGVFVRSILPIVRLSVCVAHAHAVRRVVRQHAVVDVASSFN